MKRRAAERGRRAKRALGSLAPGVLSIAVFLSTSASETVVAGPWPSEAARAEKTLRAGTEEERLKAARRLIDLSPAVAADSLKLALQDPEATVRLAGADAVLFFQASGFTELVAPWLKSRVSEERERALRILSLHPDEVAVAALLVGLTDESRELRRLAAMGLGRAPRAYFGEARAGLVGALDDPEASVRAEVATALGKIGGDSESLALASHLRDPESSVRQQVALALGVLGEASSVPALILSLADEQEEVVAAAAGALGTLADDSAVAALSDVANRRPLRQGARRAIQALLEIGGPAAESEILKLLLDAGTQNFSLAQLSGDKGARLAGRCLDKADSVTLVACALKFGALGGDPRALLRLNEEGRLSFAHVLLALDGTSERGGCLLALEGLSSKEEGVRQASVRFLSNALELSEPVAHQLATLLLEVALNEEELAGLLTPLARTSFDFRSTASRFLQSTSPLVQASAARLWVSSGEAGKEFSSLLLDGRKHVALAAFEQLRVATSSAQAEALVSMLAEGKSGRRSHLLQVLSVVSSSVSSKSLSSLTDLYRRSQGSSRELLLMSLARVARAETLLELSKSMNDAELRLLAQLALYHPQGSEIARSLILSDSARVSALAAQTLGYLGLPEDVGRLRELAEKSGRPHLVRAAALRALFELARSNELKLEPEILGDGEISSPHIGTRLAALQLALFSNPEKSEELAAELLRLELDPRVRTLAARYLLSSRKSKRAARRCQAYEVRAQVAAACAEEVSAPRSFDEVQVEPVRLEVKSPFTRPGPVADFPVTIESEFGQLTLVSGSGGYVLVPPGEIRTLGPELAY